MWHNKGIKRDIFIVYFYMTYERMNIYAAYSQLENTNDNASVNHR